MSQPTVGSDHLNKAVEVAKRAYYARPRSLLYVSVSAIALCAVLLWRYGGSIGEGLGPNLLADAIMLAVGYLLFERLLAAEGARKAINDDRVVFNAVQSTYRKAFYLWAGLVALGYGREGIESADFDPFSSEARDAIGKLGETLESDPDRASIMEDVSSKAKALEALIEQQLIIFGQLMEPYLRRQLIALKESNFVAHCAHLASSHAQDPSVLWNIGANILWDVNRHKDHIDELFPGRSVIPDLELGRENESIETIMTGLRGALNDLMTRVARVQHVSRLPYRLNRDELVLALLGLRGIQRQNRGAQAPVKN